MQYLQRGGFARRQFSTVKELVPPNNTDDPPLVSPLHMGSWFSIYPQVPGASSSRLSPPFSNPATGHNRGDLLDLEAC